MEPSHHSSPSRSLVLHDQVAKLRVDLVDPIAVVRNPDAGAHRHEVLREPANGDIGLRERVGGTIVASVCCSLRRGLNSPIGRLLENGA